MSVCLDNAGKNKMLHKHAESSAWKLGLTMWQFTNAQQKNNLTEVGFVLLELKGCAMMAAAQIDTPKQSTNTKYSMSVSQYTRVSKLTAINQQGPGGDQSPDHKVTDVG